MGLCKGLVVILAWSLVAAGAQRVPPNSVFYECNRTSIHLVVKIDPWSTGLELSPQFLHLGSCPISFENHQQGFFHFQYYFKECGFARVKSGKMVEHLINLVYMPLSLRGRFYNSPFAERINCTDYEVSVTPAPVASVTGQLSASSVLMFAVTLMNEDFSAPSDKEVFLLGSQINIEFSVQSFFHQPLRVFVDECTAAATPELQKSPRNYSIITNHGCLVDSIAAKSLFLPRPTPEVIHLSLQAFEFFGINTDIYIHCQVLAWDPEVFSDPLKKACSFHRNTKRWELLDDPSSSVCSCCESVCQGTGYRHKRDVEVPSSLRYNVVVGHLRIEKPAQKTGSYEWDSNNSLAVRSHKAAQILAQTNDLHRPTADSSSHLVTTAGQEASFFRRFFNAARGLVWHDVSTTLNTTAPTSAAASPRVHDSFVQEAQLKEAAQMNFSLSVLNEDFSVAEERGSYIEGSAIYVKAKVQSTPSMLFPKIFVDECYGTDTKQQIHPRRLYVIVENHGCLYSEESKPVASWFRKEDSELVFTIPTFLLTGKPEEEIYIHCFLTAWSQKIPTSSGKKACYFSRITSSWKNIDEPSRTSVCSCCDTFCPLDAPHLGNFKASFEGEGRLHRVVVGPLAVHKEDVPWFEGQCHTMKNLLLVSVAFVGSCVLAALFLGALLALILSLFRYSRTRKGHRLLKNKKEQPFDTELKTVVGALVVEEAEESKHLDYCKLKADTPEKA